MCEVRVCDDAMAVERGLCRGERPLFQSGERPSCSAAPTTSNGAREPPCLTCSTEVSTRSALACYRAEICGCDCVCVWVCPLSALSTPLHHHYSPAGSDLWFLTPAEGGVSIAGAARALRRRLL